MNKNTIGKSKLMQLISYLDDKDYKELGLWVRSPIHNSNQKVIDLYEIIRQKYRHTDTPINMVGIMKKLNLLPPRATKKDISPSHEHELRRTMHMLSGQIEDFLIWKANQKDTIGSKCHLIDELTIRKAFPLAPAVMRKALKIHETSPYGIQYCKHEFLLAEQDLWMPQPMKQATLAPKMKYAIDTLRQYFLSYLLKYYCSLMSLKINLKIEDDYPMQEVLKTYIISSGDIEHHTVRFYYTLLNLLQERRLEDYDELKLMLSSSNTLDNSAFKYIVFILIQFCTERILSGDKRFVQERFELYKEYLNRVALTGIERFADKRFTEIVHTGLAVGQLEWTNEFIRQYNKDLNPDRREDIMNYSKALCAFHVGKYDRAQKFLNAVDKVTDSLSRLLIKMLYIKIYYDRNELTIINIDTHPINMELDAFLQLVRPGSNIKISGQIHMPFTNFANFFRRILNRRKKLIEKQTLNINDIKTLKTELTNTESVVERNWLSDKLDELVEDVQ